MSLQGLDGLEDRCWLVVSKQAQQATRRWQVSGPLHCSFFASKLRHGLFHCNFKGEAFTGIEMLFFMDRSGRL
jgi:hypothetical protein